ncbi:hypothetical protein AWC38_SpisGene23690 [Stylophora pistillata]|uniref:Uncharacterized protein n=1 Tax=Stylophora pistillata TaxID=50429 RepID=A0A2B4R436_STYPI|nr:hypothetical protein AWC38_SpisGene23690 [Stylophora pistillata]
MLQKWNEKVYAGLDFSSQNLRGQAGYLEKSEGNVRDTIIRSLESPNNEQSEEGWKKKESNKDGAGRSKFNEMVKEKYEGQASKIRARLSKAKAEIERINTNGEITKKGKTNRVELEKECKTLTVAILVAYMEKEKSKLRRLKRGYWSRKKQHEARKINRQLQLNPRRVYGSLKGMVEAQEDFDKPKYDHGLQDNRRQDRMFTNIEEAASF